MWEEPSAQLTADSVIPTESSSPGCVHSRLEAVVTRGKELSLPFTHTYPGQSGQLFGLIFTI